MYYSKVIVQHKDGTKARGVRVALSIGGILSGGVTKNVYTDKDGIAIIPHESRGTAKVMIKGRIRGTMRVPGENVFFI